MFKKKKNIEQDFITYNTERAVSSKESSSFSLGSVIQVLIILILTGVFVVVVVFGYKYFTSGGMSQLFAEPKPVASEDISKKMYTQKEMQAMMQLVMAQMAKQQNTKPVQNVESNEDEALISLLENAQVDQITDIDTTLNMEDIDETKKATEKKSKTTIDNYNKVVVSQDAQSGDELANLSRDLGAVLENIETKDSPKSKYTTLISKEVSTREDEMRVIVVQVGDTLSLIAKRAYGSINEYNKLINANPELIKNPNFIYVGQRLRVPAI